MPKSQRKYQQLTTKQYQERSVLNDGRENEEMRHKPFSESQDSHTTLRCDSDPDFIGRRKSKRSTDNNQKSSSVENSQDSQYSSPPCKVS